MEDQKSPADVQFLNHVIETLRSAEKKNKRSLRPAEIHQLAKMAINVLASERTLIDVNPPVNVCGDIHGQMNGLLSILKLVGWPPKSRYLCLGDYVDRGPRGVEVTSLVLALKLRFPGTVFVLRGNHEDPIMNRKYTFKEECLSRYGHDIWLRFTEVFAHLPLCALVGGRIFCVHGGIPRNLTNFDQIRMIERPIFSIPDEGIVCDLLWADPSSEIQSWAKNEDRDVSHIFGEQALADFCKRMGVDVVVRGHELIDSGTEVFGRRKQLVTVHTSVNYDGHGNAAGLVSIDERLRCHRREFEPTTTVQEPRNGSECLSDRMEADGVPPTNLAQVN